MKLNNEIKLEQKHLLSQAQIQSLEMLAMCNTDLKTFLEIEYNENPLLEQKYSEAQTYSETPLYGEEKFRERQNRRDGVRDENGVDRPWENLARAEGKTIEEYLIEQIEPDKQKGCQKEIYLFMIRNVDENGFYSLSVGETAKMLQCKAEKVKECLSYLQELEPVGIFQKNLSDCLIAQLLHYGVDDAVLNQIIRENLEEIGSGKLSVITRKYGISTEKARRYKALIATLDPKPLSGYGGDTETEYVVPDVIISGTRGNFEAELNDSWIGNYSLNDYYLKMIEENTDQQLKEYFQRKLERAKMVIKGIEQRRSTVLAITNVVIKKQEEFFTGKDLLRPMTMKEVAEEIGVSASTVSRAVGDKYLQYPGGIVPYRKLFSLKVSNGKDGKGCSAQEIKKELEILIHGEDVKKPLSDSALAELLQEKGIKISRRGIAKYRVELGIPGSFERREEK